jgi:hypothetical protein
MKSVWVTLQIANVSTVSASPVLSLLARPTQSSSGTGKLLSPTWDQPCSIFAPAFPAANRA